VNDESKSDPAPPVPEAGAPASDSREVSASATPAQEAVAAAGPGPPPAAGPVREVEPPRPVPEPPRSARPDLAPKGPSGARPQLAESQEPLYREVAGFRLRLDPADLARLRELPGSRGRTDRELGEEFFARQADRLVESLGGDLEPPAEVRVVVDPYSRQAFLAVEKTIRSILSF